MKTPKSRSAAEKKPQPAVTPVMSAGGAVVGDTVKTGTAFDSPSSAVWSRYIDSRMKQFGTR